MLILECYSLLDSVITYYDYAHHQIDLPTLNSEIKRVKDKTLASLLSHLLQKNPRKRVTFKQLHNSLTEQIDINV